MKLKTSIVGVALGALCLGGCSSGGSSSNDSAGNGSSQSQQSSSSVAAVTSHNAGQDCMSSGCHSSGGQGPQFTVAGTVFRSGSSSGQAGATIRLYVPNTNTLLLELTTDSSGNFYSQEAVHGLNDGSGPPYDGVDPELDGRAMPGVVTSGSCNGCHGNGNGRLSSG